MDSYTPLLWIAIHHYREQGWNSSDMFWNK